MLDMSEHDHMEEGLPFNLDFEVWHRKDAAANGQFDDEASPERRDWCDEHDEMVADAIADILTKALPAHIVPPQLRFSYRDMRACDAEILDVFCRFDTAGFSFSLDFELYTGKGGFRNFSEPEPEPSVSVVNLTCEGGYGDFEAVWDYETGEWDKPLPLNA